MVKATTTKPKLTLWEEMRTKGIASGVSSEVRDLEATGARKELAIRKKEEAAERIRLELKSLRSEVATAKVRIFRNC